MQQLSCDFHVGGGPLGAARASGSHRVQAERLRVPPSRAAVLALRVWSRRAATCVGPPSTGVTERSRSRSTHSAGGSAPAASRAAAQRQSRRRSERAPRLPRHGDGVLVVDRVAEPVGGRQLTAPSGVALGARVDPTRQRGEAPPSDRPRNVDLHFLSFFSRGQSDVDTLGGRRRSGRWA